MDKNLFFRAFAYRTLRRLPFGGKFGGERYREAAAVADDAFVRRIYFCGLQVLSIRRLDGLTSYELGKGLPLFAVKRLHSRLCGYIGPLELFKVRYNARPIEVEHPSFKPVQRNAQKLFLDIGRIHNAHGPSGFIRVAHSLCAALRDSVPDGWEVYPVYSRPDVTGYFYANRYLRRSFGNKAGADIDHPIEIAYGDVLLTVGVDVSDFAIQEKALAAMRDAGVKVYSIFHDLIPLSHPQFCDNRQTKDFKEWMHFISKNDGIIAVSASAAEDYRKWRAANIPDNGKPFLIDWFHLGADLARAANSHGLPDDAERVLTQLKQRPSFLEVSTVEPRKGHRQTLAAFEQLWAKGVDACYVIVGRLGWQMDDFAKQLEAHPELGTRLFWLKGISDEYLNKVYDAASCVIFPTEAEGFGLAVVEGALHGKPLILRDIPVFREIAGDHATYFSGLEPVPLAHCIGQWLEEEKAGKTISSDGIRPLSWDESAKMLLSRIPGIYAK